MISVQNQPKLVDLHSLIKQLPSSSYPVTLPKLISFAHQKKVNNEVIYFYRRFPGDAVFSDQDDLAARTEQVEILQHEDAPQEYFGGFED